MEFEGTTREFTVAPIHATIIMYFQDQDVWDLSDLAIKLELSNDVTRQKMNYWVAKGILKRTNNTYHVVEDPDLHETIPEDDERDQETAVSSDAQQAQEQQVGRVFIGAFTQNLL